MVQVFKHYVLIGIRIKHLFKRRFLQVNNNISYKAIYRHTTNEMKYEFCTNDNVKKRNET